MLTSFKNFALLALLGLLHLPGLAAPGRHALIIGIGQYSAASGASPLLGVPKDMDNARKMARAMAIDERDIVELRDAQATRKNIVQALEKLRQQVQTGDQVLIYFSGHGTRLSAGNRCMEGLITYTPGAYTVADLLTEEDLARYTHPISEKADKLITLVDSCFSGGVLGSKTRSLAQDLGLRAKFSPGAGECSVAVNDRNTRSFAPVMTRLGAAQENFVQIAAANYNEVSWDFPSLGGLATHSLTQCLLGEAKDLNRSGAVSLDEIRQCAQDKVDETMRPFASRGQSSSTIQVRGARNLIVVPTRPQAAPTVVAQATPAPAAQALREPQRPSAAPNPAPVQSQAPAQVQAPVQVPAPVQAQAPVQVQAPVIAQVAAPISMAQEASVAPQTIAVSEPVQIAALAVRPEAPTLGAPAPSNAASSAVSGAVSSAAPAATAAPASPPAVSQSMAAPDGPPQAIAPLQPERETSAAALAAPQASAGSPADPAQPPLLAQAIVRPMLTALPEPEKPAEQLLASTATLQDIYAMRNGRLKLEVDAPAQLTIAKDALQFSVRSNTAGYLYAVMLGSDGRSFYLLLPNKLDGDNRIRANTTYRFPRPGWAIKAGGPEGVNHLLFVVSQSPRDPRVFVPAGSDEGGGVFTFAVTDLIARQRLIDFFVGRGVQGRNRQMAAAMVTIKEVP